MIVLREIASAKINLYLHVTGKHGDGYHLLDSLVAFANCGDILEAHPSDTLSLCVKGPFADGLEASGNSVLAAACALKAACGSHAGASLILHKNLPVASGIGGGSADAAAALRLLSRLWKIALPPAQLHSLALSLGADVPACLRSSSLYMSGIGDVVAPGPELHGLAALLVNPLVPLLTREVFSAYAQEFSLPERHPQGFASQGACLEFLGKTRNDLEAAAQARLGVIGDMLAALDACNPSLKARMSGSGATCFALFAARAQAEEAALRMADAHPGWWVKAVTLR